MFIEFCSKCHDKEEYQDPLAADLGVIKQGVSVLLTGVPGQCGMSGDGQNWHSNHRHEQG